MAVVDVMRKEGYAKVLNMVLNVKFTPSHSHNRSNVYFNRIWQPKRTNIQTNLSK